MKSYIRNFKLQVTALSSGKTKDFTSYKDASQSTGISEFILKKIGKGEYPTNLVRGKNNILFEVQLKKEVVSTLTPAWETEIPTQEFYSHHSCIKFLGCSKTVYYDRARMQPLGEPCSKEIFDAYRRPWILVVYKRSEFIPNKKEDANGLKEEN